MSNRKIFTDFKAEDASLWGNDIVNLGHSLAQTDLFSDERLAKLIETAPPKTYHVNTMDVETHDPRTRREGVLKGLSGAEALNAVKTGHIWILLQNPDQTDSAYGAMLRDIYAEIEERVPDFRSFKQKLSILISSPKVQVYYHADVPGQTLWQVRGRKRVYVYPNQTPFLPQDRIEKIVLGEAHEISLDYQEWFDEHATIVDLEPGRMLHWPLNCPHRIVNEDCLNVSFTTEHWTKPLRNAYAVNYANGILRNRLGLSSLSQPQRGLGLHARMAIAGAWKLSGLQRGRSHKFNIDFEVDPAAPNSVRDIEPYALDKSS